MFHGESLPRKGLCFAGLSYVLSSALRFFTASLFLAGLSCLVLSALLFFTASLLLASRSRASFLQAVIVFCFTARLFLAGRVVRPWSSLVSSALRWGWAHEHRHQLNIQVWSHLLHERRHPLNAQLCLHLCVLNCPTVFACVCALACDENIVFLTHAPVGVV